MEEIPFVIYCSQNDFIHDDIRVRILWFSLMNISHFLPLISNLWSKTVNNVVSLTLRLTPDYSPPTHLKLLPLVLSWKLPRKLLGRISFRHIPFTQKPSAENRRLNQKNSTYITGVKVWCVNHQWHVYVNTGLCFAPSAFTQKQMYFH